MEVTANYLEFGGQEYSFAFVRDITERRALESQLRHAQKLEGIGQLAAGIAHEINTPTQFVTDNLTFLRDSWKSTHELLERYRGAIRDAGETLPAGMAAALQQRRRRAAIWSSSQPRCRAPLTRVWMERGGWRRSYAP